MRSPKRDENAMRGRIAACRARRNSLAPWVVSREAANRSDDVCEGVTMQLKRSISNPAVVAGLMRVGLRTVTR
jgi:hypothetical protein